jgi:hypothetical protein
LRLARGKSKYFEFNFLQWRFLEKLKLKNI